MGVLAPLACYSALALLLPMPWGLVWRFASQREVSEPFEQASIGRDGFVAGVLGLANRSSASALRLRPWHERSVMKHATRNL
jgi:hypothetical protein